MPLRTVPGTDVGYYLLLLDEHGAERSEGAGVNLSADVLERAADGVTDIFVVSHGWKGDIPAAITQYDAWIGAMAAQVQDRARIREVVPDFRALVIGVHWPSLPWGVEDVGAALLAETTEADAVAAEDALSREQLVDLYAGRLGDSPPTREALDAILAHADDPHVEERLARGELTEELTDAYQLLFEQAGLAAEGPVAPPGADQEGFDAGAAVREWSGAGPAGPDPEPLTLGWADEVSDRLARLRRAVLGPVRQLSFWAMKNRARVVGEGGVHDLVGSLQLAAPEARLHLMGHSFGCIVVSAAIAGPAGGGSAGTGLPRPVDSVLLVQGAMSLWSFAGAVPFPPHAAGYFRPVLETPPRIHGPVVTTLSTHDTAVGRFYPLGAQIGDDLLLDDELPRFGGIGAFGIQGTEVVDTAVLPPSADYGFTAGRVYNVEASTVIANGSGPSGAHSDISHPEIAHLMWEAVRAACDGR